ncbi:MAG TPA: hypothetical protein VGY77_06190 [Gemmataceae bacterium]|jgi:spermidine synthase|nr:hypothetical protein [Gemmataceae bacterium]
MPVLYDAAGSHCWITVTENNGVRYLQLSGCEEGAMDVHSEKPVFHYLWFHKCSFLAKAQVRRGLILGAGAFTAPKALAIDHPGAMVDAVDIEPQLDSIARSFFRLDLPAYAGIQFHGLPAEQFLSAHRLPYDFIFDDLFDGFQHVPHLGRGADHVRRCHANLAEGGVCVKNLIFNPLKADTRAACTETWDAWKAHFPNHLALTMGDPDDGHNRLFVGLNDEEKLTFPEVTSRLARAGVPHHILQQTHKLN